MTQINDLDCPFCRYDLRGQTEPRCPECGYQFDWEDLRDPQRRIHPTLYEHHPERGASAFWRTLFHSLIPRRFWKRVRPEQKIRPRRLIRYLACLYGLMVILVGITSVYEGVLRAQEQKQLRKQLLPFYQRRATQTEVPPKIQDELRRFGSPLGVLDAHFPPITPFEVIWESASDWLPMIAMCCFWPVLTFGSLMLLPWSMRRARVTRWHVLPCVAYTSDVMLWQIAVGVGMWTELIPYRFSWLILLIYPVAAYRLTAAYRSYMQLPHAPALGITSQMIVLLATATAMILVRMP